MIQLCMAGFLGIYSLFGGVGLSRDQENFVRYKQELQETDQQAKTLEAQSLLSGLFVDAGLVNARGKHFSKMTFIISILFFFFGFVQLWAIQKVRPLKTD